MVAKEAEEGIHKRVRAGFTLQKASPSDLLPPVASASKLPLQSVNELIDEDSTSQKLH